MGVGTVLNIGCGYKLFYYLKWILGVGEYVTLWVFGS